MGSRINPQCLLKIAWAAREQAYAAYSNFAVGAALLSQSGNIFAGCNVENISFGLTICAERSAVTAAVQAGERDFVAIAIAAATATPIVPCGACRQVLAEFNHSIIVYSEGADRDRMEWVLSFLLPSPSEGILNR